MNDEFNELVEAVVQAVKTYFDDPQTPEVVSIESHPGRFDEAELRRFATNAPAIRVACLGFAEVGINEVCQSDILVALGIFLIARAQPGESRQAVALRIMRGLSRLVPQHRWGLDFTHDPERIEAKNLYSTTLNQQGVTIWAMSWQQKITVGEIEAFTEDDVSGGQRPEHVWVGFAPETGPDFVAHYDPVTEP